MRYGLKIFSTNLHYIGIAEQIYKEGFCDYIELFAYPDSLDLVEKWKSIDVKYIIHAPHFQFNVNLSKTEFLDNNMKYYQESRHFADKLDAEYIIFHPGIAGTVEETVRQLNIINDRSVIIENKPYQTINGSNICVGYSPETIKFIIGNAPVGGCCLDIGHAICASVSLGANHVDFLEKFNSLNPVMYHICDNYTDSPVDAHMNIGKGDYDFQSLKHLFKPNSKMTVETNKASKENLDDYIIDIKKLKSFYR